MMDGGRWKVVWNTMKDYGVSVSDLAKRLWVSSSVKGTAASTKLDSADFSTRGLRAGSIVAQLDSSTGTRV